MYLIKNTVTDPYFNMAAEEFCLERLNEDVLMLWRNDRAVIVGNNQNTIEEINVPYVEENQIPVIRRLSGGGAVFHDLGNVNYTLIQQYDPSLFSNYEYFASPVIKFLQSIGVEAELCGRNDLMICGYKFSGNAQTVRNGRIMHHGTLLYSSEMKDISGALKPNKKKIESKGVKSVRNRVTNISSHIKQSIPVEKFMDMLYWYFAETEKGVKAYEFSEEDIAYINKLADEKYRTWEWNFGNSPGYTWKNCRKFDYGLIDIRLLVEKGIIEECKIYGDFFGIREIHEIEMRIIGSRHNGDEINTALKDMDIDQYIAGMSRTELVEMLR